MEKDIDLINAYLNNSLSETERLAFENRLKIDSEFKKIYEEHLMFLKGLERVELKAEITAARKSMRLQKGLKFGFGVVLTLVLIVSIWFLVLHKKAAKDELREALNFETEMVQSLEASSKDSLITVVGKKGTEITFNPNDLVFQSGKKLIDETLNIELIELTNKQELLFANAQTVSNDEWLISGGAFHIDIKAKSESLKLKANKTISVRFPKNTKEEEMQIFYGDRNDKGYLNWNLSDVELKNEKHFVILSKDTIVLDEFRTKAFGGVETLKYYLKVDSLGYFANDEINKRFPHFGSIKNQKDTIIIYKKYWYVVDNKTGEVEKDSLIDIDSRTYLSQKYSDSIIAIYDSKTKKIIENEEKKKTFYESVKLSKLGWINIDQYAKYDDLVTIALENNLGFNFNTFTEEAYDFKSTWHETYLIDKDNNTMLNVYSSHLDIPKNKALTMISCVLVDDAFYVCRKAINVSENKTIKLEYKKRNKNQIKSLLRL